MSKNCFDCPCFVDEVWPETRCNSEGDEYVAYVHRRWCDSPSCPYVCDDDLDCDFVDEDERLSLW